MAKESTPASRPRGAEIDEQQFTARVRKKKQDLIVSLHDPVSGAILVSVLKFEP